MDASLSSIVRSGDLGRLPDPATGRAAVDECFFAEGVARVTHPYMPRVPGAAFAFAGRGGAIAKRPWGSRAESASGDCFRLRARWCASRGSCRSTWIATADLVDPSEVGCLPAVPGEGGVACRSGCSGRGLDQAMNGGWARWFRTSDVSRVKRWSPRHGWASFRASRCARMCVDVSGPLANGHQNDPGTR